MNGKQLSGSRFPRLNIESGNETVAALHAYARVLGGWLKSCRTRRKHWWHASLRPSLNGLTTGVVYAGTDFELELDLRENLIRGQTTGGATFAAELVGQSGADVADLIRDFLLADGLHEGLVPVADDSRDTRFPGYSASHASTLARVLNDVSAAMAEFRARIAEETSPIQLWPHHFDLSMIWLPGEKIPGQDPDDEEHSDKQMNFGFALGDSAIPDPYFYISAYPFDEEFLRVQPAAAGAAWRTEPFSGVVLPYAALLECDAPGEKLLELWTGLLSAGRALMLDEAG